jgi:hypothetical protein
MAEAAKRVLMTSSFGGVDLDEVSSFIELSAKVM